MTWNLDVPKVIHCYWGGPRLIYMRYLTIKTLLKYNPDWQIIFWYPEKAFTGKSWGLEPGYEEWNQNLCKDYLPELMQLPITFSPVDFESLKFRPGIAEVHKCDFIRINALHNYGGVWSDMDIIYFKPLEELKVNIPKNRKIETYVIISNYGHSTGFNMATENSKFFSLLCDKMNFEYRVNEYQCWGPNIFNKYFPKIGGIPNGINMDMDTVYAHNCYIIDTLMGKKSLFTEGSIGCHWYAGHSMWGKFYNQTHGGETNLPDNVIGNIIRDAK